MTTTTKKTAQKPAQKTVRVLKSLRTSARGQIRALNHCCHCRCRCSG